MKPVRVPVSLAVFIINQNGLDEFLKFILYAVVVVVVFVVALMCDGVLNLYSVLIRKPHAAVKRLN